MSRFLQRFENAKKAIAQIRAGEWEPRWNPFSNECLNAHRGDLELWIGNGPFFCEIQGPIPGAYLGLLWRHYVWWAAARKLKRDADGVNVVHPLLD